MGRLRTTIVAIALLLCCGCQFRTGPDEQAQDSGAGPATATSASSPLVDRVWARTDSTGLPGVMQIFLSDGTLVMDSCWETYRLEKWRWESDSTVVWHEDATEIRATIVRLGDEDLVLRLALPDGGQDQHFRMAQAPYLCPDMKR